MPRARPDRALLPALRTGLAILAVAAGVLVAADAAAQEPWQARASYEHQLVDSELPHWSDWRSWRGEVRRRFPAGNVAVEAAHTTRFGLGDAAVALDGYLDVAERVYLHLRVGAAPDARVLPRQDHRAELFAATATGWEGSVGYRFMAFPATDVHVLGASLARYLPGWYLRLRADVNPSFDETALFVGAAARRFLPSLDGHAELAGGAGREVVEVAAGPAVDIRASRFASLGAQAYPWPRVGLSGSLSYHGLDGLPTRVGLGLGLLLRW